MREKKPVRGRRSSSLLLFIVWMEGKERNGKGCVLLLVSACAGVIERTWPPSSQTGIHTRYCRQAKREEERERERETCKSSVQREGLPRCNTSPQDVSQATRYNNKPLHTPSLLFSLIRFLFFYPLFFSSFLSLHLSLSTDWKVHGHNGNWERKTFTAKPQKEQKAQHANPNTKGLSDWLMWENKEREPKGRAGSRNSGKSRSSSSLSRRKKHESILQEAEEKLQRGRRGYRN